MLWTRGGKVLPVLHGVSCKQGMGLGGGPEQPGRAAVSLGLGKCLLRVAGTELRFRVSFIFFFFACLVLRC